MSPATTRTTLISHLTPLRSRGSWALPSAWGSQCADILCLHHMHVHALLSTTWLRPCIATGYLLSLHFFPTCLSETFWTGLLQDKSCMRYKLSCGAWSLGVDSQSVGACGPGGAGNVQHGHVQPDPDEHPEDGPGHGVRGGGGRVHGAVQRIRRRVRCLQGLPAKQPGLLVEEAVIMASAHSLWTRVRSSLLSWQACLKSRLA